MRSAHFDCFSGISGNMILGALLDAGFTPPRTIAPPPRLGSTLTVAVKPTP
jgi:uncharacterized protein (DUF111 family)